MSTEIIAVSDASRVWFCVRLGFKLIKSETVCTAAKNVNFNCPCANLLSTGNKIIVVLFL